MTRTGTELRDKFDREWGAFRRFIASHPLTGFWCGVGAGFIGGAMLRGIF